jgi:hypothetical protein
MNLVHPNPLHAVDPISKTSVWQLQSRIGLSPRSIPAPRNGHGVETCFVASNPCFPGGAWHKWNSSISLEGEFIEEWLEKSSAGVDVAGNMDLYDYIWELFSKEAGYSTLNRSVHILCSALPTASWSCRALEQREISARYYTSSRTSLLSS